MNPLSSLLALALVLAPPLALASTPTIDCAHSHTLRCGQHITGTVHPSQAGATGVVVRLDLPRHHRGQATLSSCDAGTSVATAVALYDSCPVANSLSTWSDLVALDSVSTACALQESAAATVTYSQLDGELAYFAVVRTRKPGDFRCVL